MEDLLSLDDDVLNDVYQYWEPPVRRLPPTLWLRILHDLGGNLVEKSADGIKVMMWHHRQFKEAARARYFESQPMPQDTYANSHHSLAEFFDGRWHGVAKPFKDRSQNSRKAERMVAPQPLRFAVGAAAGAVVLKSGYASADDGAPKLNRRRLSELVYHCLEAQMIPAAIKYGCQLEYVEAKVQAGALPDLLNELSSLQLLVCQSRGPVPEGADTIATDFKKFVKQNQDILARADGFTHVVQLALNEPEESSVHAQAERLIQKSGVECVYWVNKPRQQNPCESVLVGHTGAVRCCAFSPSGAQIVSGSADTTLRVWTASSGTQLKVFPGHTDQVTSCQFLTEGVFVSGSFDATVRLWDVHAGRAVRVLSGAHSAGITSVAFGESSVGRILVSGSRDNTAAVWIWTGELLQDQAAPTLVLRGHSDVVSGVAVAASPLEPQFRVVTCSYDGSVRVWDESGNRLASFTGEHSLTASGGRMTAVAVCGMDCIIAGNSDRTIRTIALSPGRSRHLLKQGMVVGVHRDAVMSCGAVGDLVVSSGGENDRSVRVWVMGEATKEWEERAVFMGHTAQVFCVRPSPDMTRIVSAGWDQTLRVWRFENDHAAPHQEISIVRVNTAHEIIVTVAENVLSLWSLSGGHLRDVVTHSGTITCCEVHDYEPAGAKEPRDFVIAYATESGFVGGERGKGMSITLSKKAKHSAGVMAMCVVDARRLVTGSSDGGLIAWKRKSDKHIYVARKLAGHTGAVTSCVSTTRGALIRVVTSSADKTVRVWGFKSGECLAVYSASDAVWQVSLSPDETKIAAACQDRQIRIWELESQRTKPVSVRGFSAKVTSCVFLSNDRLVASGRDKALRLCDLTTATVTAQLTGHDSGIRSFVVCDASAGMGFSISADKSVRYWDLWSGQCTGTMFVDANCCAVGASDGVVVCGVRSGGIAILQHSRHHRK
eukprot:c8984_g1_i1.p1 GENE.c8984_g1_i1~~c8984_g1_i1.p1  ORF type:complete len:971 (+),score=233.04 c8984_g1_i1:88-2913(+)